jgi:hypothetical protein
MHDSDLNDLKADVFHIFERQCKGNHVNEERVTIMIDENLGINPRMKEVREAIEALQEDLERKIEKDEIKIIIAEDKSGGVNESIKDRLTSMEKHINTLVLNTTNDVKVMNESLET